jgi:PAS domain S-box-containing protein
VSQTSPRSDPPGEAAELQGRLRELEAENARLCERLESVEAEALHHRSVRDSLPIPVFTKDARGRYTGCNTAYEEAIGVARGELLGKTLGDRAAPEVAEFHGKWDREMIAHPANQAYEYTFRSGKGGRRYGLFLRAPLFDSRGQVSGLVGVILDLTERKEAEEALRQSEERLKLILQYSSDGINIVEFDLQTYQRRLILCNDRYVQMSGRTREELLAADDLNPFVREYDDPGRAKEDYRKILEGVPYSGRGSWIRPDGKKNFFEWTAAPICFGSKTYIIGIDRDVTERHLAELALRRSEEQYRTVVEASGETIAVVDAGGVFRFINQTGARMLGRAAEQVVGKTLWEVFPPELADSRAEIVREVLRTGETFHGELTLPPGGPTRRVLAAVQKLRDDPLGGARVLIVARDLTREIETQESLRRSEEHYRTLVESMEAAICQYDLDGVCLFMNGPGARWLGLAPAQAIGRTMWDLFPKEHADYQMEIIGRTIREGRRQVVQYQSVVRGKPAWFRVTVEPLSSPPGQRPRALVFARNTTEQKEMEAALEASNRRFRGIVENSWDVIFETDLNGRYTYGNPAAERLTGYPLRELIGKSLFQVVAPEYHEMMRERLRHRQSGGETPQPFQFEIVHRDGHRLFVDLITSLVWDEGMTVGIQGIARDVTDRLRAERELRATRERLGHLISASPAVIYSMELAGSVGNTYVSPNAEAVFGYPAQRLMDHAFWDQCLHPDDHKRVHEKPRLAGGDKTGRYEYRFRHADGTYHWMLDEFNVLPSLTGGPPEVIGHVMDITARKEAEEALRQAHRQLVQAREVERRRLAAELHDSLGQELISLHLRMQGLLPDLVGHLDKKGAAELDQIVHRCQEAIGNVRTISHGLYPPLLESVGLCAALQEMVHRLGSPIPVTVDWASSLEKFRWPLDVEIALFRIAQEALHNALAHGQASHIALGLEYKRHQVILSIRDDGVGFDPHTRGGGLGLFTMRDRAQTAGGELVVESRPGATLVEARVPAEARRRE